MSYKLLQSKHTNLQTDHSPVRTVCIKRNKEPVKKYLAATLLMTRSHKTLSIVTMKIQNANRMSSQVKLLPAAQCVLCKKNIPCIKNIFFLGMNVNSAWFQWNMNSRLVLPRSENIFFGEKSHGTAINSRIFGSLIPNILLMIPEYSLQWFPNCLLRTILVVSRNLLEKH